MTTDQSTVGWKHLVKLPTTGHQVSRRPIIGRCHQTMKRPMDIRLFAFCQHGQWWLTPFACLPYSSLRHVAWASSVIIKELRHFICLHKSIHLYKCHFACLCSSIRQGGWLTYWLVYWLIEKRSIRSVHCLVTTWLVVRKWTSQTHPVGDNKYGRTT